MQRLAATAVAWRNPNRLGKIAAYNTVFLCCDIQERFRPLIHAMTPVIQVGRLMSKVSKELDIPFVVTEQYPSALGKTVDEIDVSHAKVFAKTKFSMIVPEVEPFLEENKCTSVVLFGIEAHVCVLQTTLDLIERGIDVHIIVDGTSSQRQFDRMTAFNVCHYNEKFYSLLQRLREAGAFLTTAESLIFQLMGDSKHPNFKVVQGFIKEHAAEGHNPDLTPSSL